MKSFLLTAVLLLMFTAVAYGQNVKKPIKNPGTTPQTFETKTTTALRTADPEEKSAFDKFYQRLSISYFGILASPNLRDGNFRNAAVSPQWSGHGNRCRGVCDDLPANIFSQVAFVYNFGAKLSFSLIPRWTQFLSSPRDAGTAPNSSLLQFEDALVAFQGVIYQSPNKAVDWWIRPAVRLPNMRTSRYDNRPEVGSLTQNVELLGFLTWHINPTWELGLLHQQRAWIYEDRYQANLIQHYVAPFVYYKLNDKTKIQAFYEHILRHGSAGGGPTHGNLHTEAFWNALMVGVARDITPKLNVFPYVTTFLDKGEIGPGRMFIGAWIQYVFK